MLINLLELLRGQSYMRLNFLYEQAAAQTSLSAELTGDLLGNADRVNNNNNNIILTLQFSLTALLNLQLLALKRPASSSSDLNCRRTNPTIASNNNNVQLVRDNIEELIYISKVKNNYNNLNIIVTNPTSREFSRVDIKSLTRLCLLIDRAKAYNISKFYKGKNIQLLRPANVANVFNIVVSKLDKVPTQELSSYIKIELLRDNSRKFYYLVITSKDTHYKQTIKKAYIILLERALLILFII
ncbi:hypothetical protein HBI33_231220 [Parastagonospora nodorum]|nr:hypothetical protein HBI33_231220 [Parastagonospora nodorum]